MSTQKVIIALIVIAIMSTIAVFTFFGVLIFQQRSTNPCGVSTALLINQFYPKIIITSQIPRVTAKIGKSDLLESKLQEIQFWNANREYLISSKFSAESHPIKYICIVLSPDEQTSYHYKNELTGKVLRSGSTSIDKISNSLILNVNISPDYINTTKENESLYSQALTYVIMDILYDTIHQQSNDSITKSKIMTINKEDFMTSFSFSTDSQNDDPIIKIKIDA